MNLPKRPKIGVYKTRNGSIVEVFAVHSSGWGIHGKYLTGPLKNNVDTWDDEPLRVWISSYDTDKEGFSIVERIDKNEFPEYFL